LENYKNIVIISADRNGSTAFQHNILGANFNNDDLLWMGECFSQDHEKGQPPSWYNPSVYSPRTVIDTVNMGTGKSVLLKVQITYPNFNKSFLDIRAERKIFFHRDLFQSTLSRCIAQTTGKWWWTQEEGKQPVNIDLEFFVSRLEWRIEQYYKHIDNVLSWANEVYRYETYNYSVDNLIKKNKDKELVVKNYKELYDIFLSRKEIAVIEEKICSKIT